MRMLIAGAALLLVAAKLPAPSPVTYSVGIADSHSLAVEMRLDGDRDGETVIDLPDHWAGSTDLWRGISNVTVEGGTVTGEGGTRTIRHAPGARLVVRYKVASGGTGMEETGEKARPTVQPDWFFFHGEGVFAAVDGRRSAPVRFHWGAVPAGWKLATDLGPMSRRPGRLDDLIESVGIGGPDVQIVSKAYGRATLTVAVHGTWGFTPADLLDRVGLILTAEHGFWREPPQSFLVTLAPIPDQPGSTSYTGTGRTNAFSILSTSNLDLVQATRVLAHEYDHRWVPRLLGGLPEQEEGRDYWFSEGFDDYLTARILLGSGLWTLSDWFANKNEVLLRYATSPARAVTGAEVAARFWKDENVERISYDRGHLLAFLLDARIRSATSGRLSLDDVLRAQRRRVRRSGPSAAALFPDVVRRVAGIDIRPELDRYAVRGEPFLLTGDISPSCIRVKTETRRAFTRGFDAAATLAAGAIRGVDPAGPAYAAGMRDGMKFLKREAGKIGDSTQPIAYRVSDGQGERVIRYLPAAKESFPVQQLEPTGDTLERCRLLLGGAR